MAFIGYVHPSGTYGIYTRHLSLHDRVPCLRLLGWVYTCRCVTWWGVTLCTWVSWFYTHVDFFAVDIWVVKLLPVVFGWLWEAMSSFRKPPLSLLMTFSDHSDLINCPARTFSSHLRLIFIHLIPWCQSGVRCWPRSSPSSDPVVVEVSTVTCRDSEVPVRFAALVFLQVGHISNMC